MERAGHVDSEFVGLEMWAAARLLDQWAKCRLELEGPVERSEDRKQRKKIATLRKAVIAGKSGREAWEREFVEDELMVMGHAVRYVRGLLADQGRNVLVAIERGEISVPYPLHVSGKPVLRRPMPGPLRSIARELDRIGDRRSSDGSIAKGIVASRLQTTRGQIYDALKRKRRTLQATPLQQLAASVFYDLSLSPPQSVKELRSRLLRSLSRSGYRPICLYYLVQRAQTIKPKQCCPACNPQQIDLLCQALDSSGQGHAMTQES